MSDDETAEHHWVGKDLYLCHTDDHYCPPAEECKGCSGTCCTGEGSEPCNCFST